MRIRYHLGNLLIAGSLILLLFIYLPLLFLFLPVADTKAQTSSFYIEIPKIKAKADIVENVDPFNEKEYSQKLKQGIAHAKGSALPGEMGNIFLFAHSSLPPWEMTRTNTPFFKLGQLEKGDQINVYRDGQVYNFRVVGKKEVWPNEVSFLTTSTSSAQLTLQTCTPLGTALKRLLVIAQPI